MKYTKRSLYTIENSKGKFYHPGKWDHWRDDKCYLHHNSASRCISNAKRTNNAKEKALTIKKYLEPVALVDVEVV